MGIGKPAPSGPSAPSAAHRPAEPAAARRRGGRKKEIAGAAGRPGAAYCGIMGAISDIAERSGSIGGSVLRSISRSVLRSVGVGVLGSVIRCDRRRGSLPGAWWGRVDTLVALLLGRRIAALAEASLAHVGIRLDPTRSAPYVTARPVLRPGSQAAPGFCVRICRSRFRGPLFQANARREQIGRHGRDVASDLQMSNTPVPSRVLPSLGRYTEPRRCSAGLSPDRNSLA